MRKLTWLIIILMLFLSACASDTALKQENESLRQQLTDLGVLETQAEPQMYTAEEIVNLFIEKGLPLGKLEIYDEETDLNKLLGRPNQYTSKVNFEDTRVKQIGEYVEGGTVEIFNNEADAQNRETYLNTVTSTFSPSAQYMYRYGVVLLRISYDLLPDQAEEYNNVIKSIIYGTEYVLIKSEETTTTEAVPNTIENIAVQKDSDKPDDANELVHLFETIEYNWEYYNSYYAALEITNNSNYDVRLSITVQFLDSNGNIVGISQDEFFAFGSKCTILAVFSNDIEYEIINYIFDLKYEDYFISVLADLKTEASIVGDKAILSVTNNGEHEADFVEYYILFFKSGAPVYSKKGYCMDMDNMIKPNRTEYKEVESYVDFDEIKVFTVGTASK